MNFFDVLKARHSIRQFQPTAVEAAKLDAILAAANGAPSALNLQSYEIYLARGPQEAAAVASATWDQNFVAQAPLVLVFCANPGRCLDRLGEEGARLFSLQDATIACTFAMLAATAQGLCNVWIGAFDAEGVRKIIGAAEGITPIAILPVGYPAQEPELTTRRALTDLVHALPPKD